MAGPLESSQLEPETRRSISDALKRAVAGDEAVTAAITAAFTAADAAITAAYTAADAAIIAGLSVSNTVCNGRLTLTSGTPVTTSDVTAASTIYFTPYRGNQVALYSGSAWVIHTLTERSLALSGLTSGRPYDVFLYDNAGTLTLELLAWTSDTARATALAYQDGVLVKSGAATRRYLGTLYTTGTSTTEDSKTKRYLWNYAIENRVKRVMRAYESTASWTYNSATFRGANNTTAARLNFVIGVAEDAVTAVYSVNGYSTNATVLQVLIVGIGLDSTTTISSDATQGRVPVSAYVLYNTAISHYDGVPGIGLHYLQALEAGIGSGTAPTWYGGTNLCSIMGTVMG